MQHQRSMENAHRHPLYVIHPSTDTVLPSVMWRTGRVCGRAGGGGQPKADLSPVLERTSGRTLPPTQPHPTRPVTRAPPTVRRRHQNRTYPRCLNSPPASSTTWPAANTTNASSSSVDQVMSPGQTSTNPTTVHAIRYTDRKPTTHLSPGEERVALKFTRLDHDGVRHLGFISRLIS